MFLLIFFIINFYNIKDINNKFLKNIISFKKGLYLIKFLFIYYKKLF